MIFQKKPKVSRIFELRAFCGSRRLEYVALFTCLPAAQARVYELKNYYDVLTGSIITKELDEDKSEYIATIDNIYNPIKF